MACEEFSTEEVREALRVLYDPVALSRSSLADKLLHGLPSPDLTARAVRLRGILLDAIELLQPARTAARTPATRCYEVLALHFVDGLPISQIANDLDISDRHAYRDLARAEERLAELLRVTHLAGDSSASMEASKDSLREELESLSPQMRQVNPAEILLSAMRITEPLACDLNLNVAWQIEASGLVSFANESLLKQTLVHVLSVVMRNSSTRDIDVIGEVVEGGIRVAVRAHIGSTRDPEELFAEAFHLAAAQRLSLQCVSLPDSRTEVRLTLPVGQRRLLLVIEDNPGAIELYRRYLTASGEWDVAAVPDPRLSFELARKLRPAAILLDILMPEQDGWTVLQILRTQPETRDIPILVCSVYDEPELAYALGASAYIKKPVSESQLAGVLWQCLQNSGSTLRH